MPEGNGRSFQVHCSGKVAKELKKLQHKASPARRKLIAAAFQKIVNKLRTDASNAGEPRFHLVSLKMQVRALAISPLVIEYGVCEDRPFVFIRSGKLLHEPAS